MASHPNHPLRIVVIVMGCIGAVPGGLLAAYLVYDSLHRASGVRWSDLGIGMACAVMGPILMSGSSWLVRRGHAWTHLGAVVASTLLSVPVAGLIVFGGGVLFGLMIMMAWLALPLCFALTVWLIVAERRYPSR